MKGFADVSHLPVLCQESVDALNVQDGGCYVDGTFGLGGYSREILSRAKCSLVSFDRDPFSVTQADCLIAKYRGRFSIIHGCFGDMDDLLSDVGIASVDSIVLDLGVSSPQLDDPDRGFSFRFDGPLDIAIRLFRAVDPFSWCDIHSRRALDSPSHGCH